MGSNNTTHHDGQRLVECPNCPRSIRTTPTDVLPEVSTIVCGNCKNTFVANSETGEVVSETL